MNFNLAGKVAVVTGGGSQTGFGKGICLALATEGCNVVILDVDIEGAKKTAAEVEAMGCKSLAYEADLTDGAVVTKCLADASQKMGKIDILVNNAGRSTPNQLFVDKTPEDWEPDLKINLYSVLNCCKAVLPQMLERKSGKIINICSGVGTRGMAGSSLYSAAKGAVASFTLSLSKEVIGSGINVNGVSPGIGNTNFLRSSKMLPTEETPPEFEKAISQHVPAGRFTLPRDIGTMCTYLASDVADYIVGQVIDVDGGSINSL